MYSIQSVFRFSLARYPAEGPHMFMQCGRPYALNLQDANRAMTSFELELFAYYLCAELINHHMPDRYQALLKWFRTPDGKEANELAPEENIRRELDEIYEDILAIVEFSLNRLTAYSDDSMEQIMTGIRFSLAYYMKMDRSRTEFHQVGKKLNTICFNRKDLRSVACLVYNTQWASRIDKPLTYDAVLEKYNPNNSSNLENTRLFFKTIHNTVDRTYDGQSIYVEIMRRGISDECFRDILRACWHFSGTEQALAERPFVPIMELADYIMDRCCGEPILCLQNESDYLDMCGDILVPNNALLGYIGNRDSNLNFCKKPISEVVARYSSEEGVLEIKKCMRFIRVLHCILSGSEIREAGRNHQILPKFKSVTLMRMMDSEMFGKAVYLPNMIFVSESSRYYEEYQDYLVSIGFRSNEASHGNSFEKVIESLEDMEVLWRPSGRVKNVKIRGCFGHMRSVSLLSMDEFRNVNPNNFKPGTILVCESSAKQQIIRLIRYALREKGGDRDRVWRIVTLLPDSMGVNRDYTSVDVSDGHIVEVGLTTYKQLFDTHSNGILVRTLNALDRTMGAICRKYNVEHGDKKALRDILPTESLIGCLEKEFVTYYESMVREIRLMQKSPVMEFDS